MKKLFALITAIAVMLSCTACSAPQETETNQLEIVPQISRIRSICELAVMDCYYHNVAKSFEEDVEGFLWWTKDRHFWIEYNAVVRYGIDVSYVDISVEDDTVVITLPRAKLLDCTIDDPKDFSYIVAKDSASITAEDEKTAIAQAQDELIKEASGNSTLLDQAQQRAEELLREYIKGINDMGQKTYSVRFNVIDENGQSVQTSAVSEETSGSETNAQS